MDDIFLPSYHLPSIHACLNLIQIFSSMDDFSSRIIIFANESKAFGFCPHQLELRLTWRHSFGICYDQGSHEGRPRTNWVLLRYIRFNLGNVDSVTIIGTIVGTFLMINLTKSIKKYFLIFSLIHTLFFCMLTISDQIPEKTANVIIMVCMFIVGVAKASIVFPQILFSSFFDS